MGKISLVLGCRGICALDVCGGCTVSDITHQCDRRYACVETLAGGLVNTVRATELRCLPIAQRGPGDFRPAMAWNDWMATCSGCCGAHGGRSLVIASCGGSSRSGLGAKQVDSNKASGHDFHGAMTMRAIGGVGIGMLCTGASKCRTVLARAEDVWRRRYRT